MRFDLRPLRLTTGWSEPNAVVSRTLSVSEKSGVNFKTYWIMKSMALTLKHFGL